MSTLAIDLSLASHVHPTHEVKVDLLHAAVAGHTDELQLLLENHPIPTEWRNLAHSLAMGGGHFQAAYLLKPDLH